VNISCNKEEYGYRKDPRDVQYEREQRKFEIDEWLMDKTEEFEEENMRAERTPPKGH
jgi:hypothetical protein